MIMKKTIIRNYSMMIYAVVFVLLFIMLYKAPFRLDDLTWGGRIGIERLKSHFAGYNGRYLGNLVVIILTRLPRDICVSVRLSILIVFLYFTYKILNDDLCATVFFCCLFLTMPLTIFTQTITWIAGFSNYVFSMMFATILICVDLNVLKGRSIKNAKHLVIYSIAVLSGQLFVETATLYAVVFSVAMIIVDHILYY